MYVPDLVWDIATRLGDTPIGHWPKDSLFISLYVYSKPSLVLSHFYTQYLPPSPIFLIFFSDNANVSLSPSDPFHALPPNSLISQTHIPQLVFTSYSTPNICFRWSIKSLQLWLIRGVSGFFLTGFRRALWKCLRYPLNSLFFLWFLLWLAFMVVHLFIVWNVLRKVIVVVILVNICFLFLSPSLLLLLLCFFVLSGRYFPCHSRFVSDLYEIWSGVFEKFKIERD